MEKRARRVIDIVIVITHSAQSLSFRRREHVRKLRGIKGSVIIVHDERTLGGCNAVRDPRPNQDICGCPSIPRGIIMHGEEMCPEDMRRGGSYIEGSGVSYSMC
jgi:hypothetical protein